MSSQPTPQECQKQVQELLRLPGNTTCADCLQPSPTWASINLGVFICLDCSAHHRAMGTHISKVKSTTLDKWNLDMVQGMKRAGNIKANSYWEKGLPPNFPRPTTAEARGIFIRQKYEQGKFKQPLPTEPLQVQQQPQQAINNKPVVVPSTAPPLATNNEDKPHQRRSRKPPSSSFAPSQAHQPAPSPLISPEKTDLQQQNRSSLSKQIESIPDLLDLTGDLSISPNSKTENGGSSSVAQAKQQLSNNPPSAGSAGSSFSFLSSSSQQMSNGFSGLQATTTASSTLSATIASELGQVNAELDGVAGRLKAASNALDQIQQSVAFRPQEALGLIHMNLASTTFLTVNDTSLERILSNPLQAKAAADALRKVADAIEQTANSRSTNQTSISTLSAGRLKDELASECAKLDLLQMKKIDSLVLGPAASPELLENRKVISNRIASLVNEAGALHNRAAAMVSSLQRGATTMNSSLTKPFPLTNTGGDSAFAFATIPNSINSSLSFINTTSAGSFPAKQSAPPPATIPSFIG